MHLVHASSPVKTVQELVALAKSKPGELIYASAGLASDIHLASEQFRQVAGIEAIHVPYRGGGPAIVDFIGGKIDFTFTTIPSIIEHVRAGRVRRLGVTTPRVPQMPDVPSLAEVGLADVDAARDIGILAPAGSTSDEFSKHIDARSPKGRVSSRRATSGRNKRVAHEWNTTTPV